MHERRFNPENMAKLDSPERKAVLPPESLLEKLALNENESATILDLGAGTGYFSIPVSERTSGTILALDIEPMMLEVIRSKAKQKQIKNIQTIEGRLEQIPLEEESVDRVIASLVLHEAEPLQQALSEIHRVLRRGGRCACLEWEKQETDQGPPLHHRIGSEELTHSFEQAGFTILETDHPTGAHYVLVVQK
ncbi:SAM-dependent methyltransferase [Paenibacillus sp. VTT E-133280]|uniref:class I SAM-dependent methyltransferase n=1 Tax=Paenibacillus TaxID=44249 RepID=UPI00061F0505|nr:MULTISPECIES: class I SAM-dependent methyltransferase [Paenibacillus]KKC47786.1 methyltransferase type 11 [Paenibacillus sp. D9]MEC0259845.1 class I SAM-dependent methyltransferase [Paenibacillus lautus]OZQ68821.1 SAM-dependent methyltransferase [Paenibacillus sp. VTT E-133280]